MRAWRAARQPSLPLCSRHRASSRASSWFWSVRLLRTKLRSATRRSWRDSNRRLKQESFRDAVRSVAEDFKVKRSRVYDLGLALERKDRGAP